MSFLGDLTIVPSLVAVLEATGGTKLSTQVPNMGIECEFACDMSPTEVSRVLDKEMGDESFAGADLDFEGMDSYGSMAAQQGGVRRIWAVTGDDTANDHAGGGSGDDEDPYRDQWESERAHELMREEAQEKAATALSDWERAVDERQAEFQDEHFEKRAEYIEEVLDHIEDARKEKDPTIINALAEYYDETYDPEIRELLSYISDEEIENKAEFNEGDKVKLDRGAPRKSGDRYVAGNTGTVIRGDKNNVLVKMDKTHGGDTPEKISLPLNYWDRDEKAKPEPKQQELELGVRKGSVHGRRDVENIVRAWGGENRYQSDVGNGLYAMSTDDYDVEEYREFLKEVLETLGLDDDEAESLIHHHFAQDADGLYYASFMEGWANENDVGKINGEDLIEPDPDGSYGYQVENDVRDTFADALSEFMDSYYEQAAEEYYSENIDNPYGSSGSSHGVELVSPRIAMTDSNIRRAAEVFQEAIEHVDGRTHPGAGMHVHIGYRRGLKPIHLFKFAYNIAADGDDIQGKAKRKYNSYASRFKWFKSQVHQEVQDSLESKAPKALLRGFKEMASQAKKNRYNILNLQNKHTAEVRIGSSELIDNTKDMISWLSFIRDCYRKAVADDWMEFDEPFDIPDTENDGEHDEKYVRVQIGGGGQIRVQIRDNPKGEWKDYMSNQGLTKRMGETEIDDKEFFQLYRGWIEQVREDAEKGAKTHLGVSYSKDQMDNMRGNLRLALAHLRGKSPEDNNIYNDAQNIYDSAMAWIKEQKSGLKAYDMVGFIEQAFPKDYPGLKPMQDFLEEAGIGKMRASRKDYQETSNLFNHGRYGDGPSRELGGSARRRKARQVAQQKANYIALQKGINTNADQIHQAIERLRQQGDADEARKMEQIHQAVSSRTHEARPNDTSMKAYKAFVRQNVPQAIKNIRETAEELYPALQLMLEAEEAMEILP